MKLGSPAMPLPAHACDRLPRIAAAVPLLLLAAGVFFSPPRSLAEEFAAGVIIGGPAGWTIEQTPVDYLDVVGLQAKARWRQLYREPPPLPHTERARCAFTLGSLISDALLALQGQDSQRIRNSNQDILAYCRVLGLGEKMSPRLMAQGKLAEQENWAALRQEAVDGHQELARLLREQHDEDLATLVDLGVWLRILEIASAVASASPDASTRHLCIGSVDLIADLQRRFGQLSEPVRNHEQIAQAGELLGYLYRNWSGDSGKNPTAEFAVKTHEKIKHLMRKLTLK